MRAGPQFSLRTLLFVTAVVCLAAAASARIELPSTPDGGGWDDLGLAIRIQTLVRLAACIAFPTMTAAGAFSRNRAIRAFCIGATLPAALPLMLVCVTDADSLRYPGPGGIRDAMTEFQKSALGLRNRIVSLWACALCIGFISVIFRWFLNLGDNNSSRVRRGIAAGSFALAAMLAISVPSILRLEPELRAVSYAQITISEALCVLFPALLGLVIAEGNGGFRAFSAGAILPALIPVVILWDRSIHIDQWRYSVVAIWAMMPVSGLTCLFFYWLFERGVSKGQVVADR